MTAPAENFFAMRTAVATALVLLLVTAVGGRELRPVTTPAPLSLRCVLAADPTACPDKLPPDAEATLLSAPEALRTALRSEGLEFESDVIEQTPDALLPLMPPRLLATMKGAAAAHVCAARPGNAGAAAALAEAMRSVQQRRDFLEGLGGVSLSEHVEVVLGAATAPWLADDGSYTDTLTLMRRAASGLVARLPPAALLNLPSDHAAQYLFVLGNWHDYHKAAEASWHRAPGACRSAWAMLAAKEQHLPTTAEWTLDDLSSRGFFLEGASPTSLGALQPDVAASPAVAGLALSRLRARALLAALPATPVPSINTSLLLQPALLKELKPGLDLAVAWRKATAADAGRASLATARQIAELLVASGGHPLSAGHFAWALPAEQRRQLAVQSAEDLDLIDSHRFSRAEARALLRELPPETWLQASGLLRGVRASEFAELRTGDLPQPLLLHLLREVPADVTAPAALALLERVRPQLVTRSPFFDAALSGPGAGRLMGLLSPHELRLAARSLVDAIRTTPAAAARLPQRALSVALSSALEGKHTADAARMGALLLGLRCSQLRAAGSAHAPVLLDALNAELRAAGRPFPVHLRRCAKDAMAAFLKLRAQAQGLPDNAGPLAALAPSDAEAFGAFVSAGLPAASLRTAPEAGRAAVLASVGRLPLEELLAGAGSAQAARALAALGAEKDEESNHETPLDAPAALHLGALLWLLPAEHVRRVQGSALRAALEAVPEDAARVPCADAAAIEAWGEVALSAFGPAKEWTPAVLGVLADMLIALPDVDLDAVPVSAWRDAADVLSDAFAFHRELRWPEGATVLEACTSGMTESDAVVVEARVRALARRIAVAAREQLATAAPFFDGAPGRARSASGPGERNHPVSMPEFDHKPETIHVIEVEGSEGRRRRDAGDDLRSELLKLVPAAPSSTHGPAAAAAASSDRSQEKVDEWCEGWRAAGPAAGAALTAEDIEQAPDGALAACVETLGKLQLAPDVVAAFWKRAAKGEVSAEWEDAGALLAGARAEHVVSLSLNLSLSRPEALDALWAWTRAASQPALDALVQNLAYANKEPETAWPPQMLAAAGPLLCALAEPYFARVLSSEGALTEAAAALGASALPDCPRPCLAALARLAGKQRALGPADKWTADDAHVLGVIVAGVSGVWKSLSAGAAEGVTAGAIRCMPAPEFQFLTSAQALALTPSAAAAISDAQAMRVADARARIELSRARRAAALSAAPAPPQDDSVGAGAEGGAPSVALDAAVASAAAAAMCVVALGAVAGRA